MLGWRQWNRSALPAATGLGARPEEERCSFSSVVVCLQVPDVLTSRIDALGGEDASSSQQLDCFISGSACESYFPRERRYSLTPMWPKWFAAASAPA